MELQAAGASNGSIMGALQAALFFQPRQRSAVESGDGGSPGNR